MNVKEVFSKVSCEESRDEGSEGEVQERMENAGVCMHSHHHVHGTLKLFRLVAYGLTRGLKPSPLQTHNL